MDDGGQPTIHAKRLPKFLQLVGPTTLKQEIQSPLRNERVTPGFVKIPQGPMTN